MYHYTNALNEAAARDDIRTEVHTELMTNSAQQQRVQMYGEAVERLRNNYDWLTNLSDVDSVYAALRDRLDFGEQMRLLIASQCELRTGAPMIEREMRERSDVLSRELRQFHEQQWQAMNQHVQNTTEQQQHELSRVSHQTGHAVEELTRATARWNTMMANPSRAGALGEQDVFNILTQHFQQRMDVRNTSNETASGDIQLRNLAGVDAGEVLIEVKMYSNRVPTQEVDKFVRDVTACDLPLAVMCSLTSGITGKRRVELVSINGKMCLFLANISEAQLLLGIEMLQMLHTTQQHTASDTNDACALDVLAQRLQHGLDSLDNTLRNEDTHFRLMEDCLRRQTLACERMHRLLQEHHQRLSELRTTIRDQFAQDLSQASHLRVLTPTEVARTAAEMEQWIREKQDEVQMNPSNRTRHSIDVATLVQELVRRGSCLRRTCSGFALEHIVAPDSTDTVVYGMLIVKRARMTLCDVRIIATVSLSTGQLHAHLHSILDTWAGINS